MMLNFAVYTGKLDAYRFNMADFAENWELKPIVEIGLGSNSNGCPEGFEPLINRTWPGTSPGCDCSWSQKGEFAVYKGDCFKNITRHGCWNIQVANPIHLNIFHGSYICGKRAGENYLKI
jgi:hypothetical protein